jgi:hypothetical protein
LEVRDRAFDKINNQFDLANKTINLPIQWIHQNGCCMPEPRKKATELILLKPSQIDEIEKIAAESFSYPAR